MDAPKCRICGKKHYGLCSESDLDVLDKATPTPEVLESDTVEEPKAKVVDGKGCPECGATAQTFADAEKWATIREKQRLRMKRKRHGQDVC